MSNFKSSCVRTLNIVTSVATILWSVGVFSAAPAMAATLNNGDLVKASGTTAVYLVQGTTKRVFPHLNVYLSWGYPTDFSTVKTVSAADLAQYTEGDPVPFRDGYLFRGTASGLGGLSATAVYLVADGVRKPVQSAAVYQSLFNDPNWARVTWVPDDLLTKFNYPLGSVVSATTTHDSGTLIKYAGTDQVYLLSAGKKRALGTGALAANRYNAAMVVTVPATEVYSDGDAVTGYELALTMPTPPAGSTAVATTVTGQVTVALSSMQPSASSLPMGSFYAPLMYLDVHNGTNTEVKVTGLSVQRYGIMADRDINGVIVTDADGLSHGNITTFGQAVSSPGFGTNPIKVAPGATAVVKVNVNLVATATASSTSNTLGVQLVGPSSVTVVDGSGNPVSVGGTFPMKGPLMGTVSGTGSLGDVTLSSQSVNGGSTATPTSIDQGVKDYDAAKFRFQESTGNENVELLNVTIQNIGSASASDFFNIRLVDQDGNVVAQTDAVVGNQAKMTVRGTGVNRGPSGGYLLKQGQLRDFTVRVDTSATSNSGGRTINFTVQNDYDIRAVGISTGVGVHVTQGGAAAPNSFPVGSGQNNVSFRTGTISLSRSTDSLSGKIAAGATDLEIATFDVRAFGEDLELQDVGFVILNAAGAGLAAGSHVPTGTVKIKNDAGQTIYSITAATSALYSRAVTTTFATACTSGTGTNCISAGADGLVPAGSSSTTKLNNTYVVKAGTTGKLRFVMDVNQSAAATDGYQVAVGYLQFRRLSSNILATSTSTVTANALTVESTVLSVTPNTSFNPQTLVKGGSLQKVGSFNLQAGAAESQTVTSLTVKLCMDDAATNFAVGTCSTGVLAATYTAQAANVSNVELREGTTRLAPAANITTTAGTTYSLQGFTVPANQTRVVDVYAVVSTAFAPSGGGVDRLGTTFTVNSTVGGQSQSSQAVAEAAGQSVTFQNNGTLVVSALGSDGTVNTKKVLHASETDVPLFRFQIRESSNAEAMTVQKIYLGVSSAQNTLTDYKLFDADTNTQLGSTAPANIATGITDGEVRFTGLNYQVPKGGTKSLLVKASTVDGGTMTVNSNINLGPTFMEYVGQSSGSTTRDSGGLVISSTVAANPTITVNDSSQFEAADTVRFDLNGDGDFADNLTATNGVNENTTYTILAVPTATTITLAAGTLTTIASISGRVVPVNSAFSSSNAHAEEVEPIITALQVGTGLIGPETPVGTFVFTGQGNQTLNLVTTRFEVSGSYNYNGATGSNRGFSPTNYKLVEADATTGAVGQKVQAADGSDLAPFLVYTKRTASAAGTGVVNDAAIANGDTTVTITVGTADLAVGDRISFSGDTNGGAGYIITSVSTPTAPVFTPAIQNASSITNGAAIAVIASNPTLSSTAVLESGQVVGFTFVTPVAISGGSSRAYALLADTNRIKDPNTANTTASTTVRMLGNRADQTTDAAAGTTNGLTWNYSRTTGGTSASHTLSDSYPVTGKSIIFL